MSESEVSEDSSRARLAGLTSVDLQLSAGLGRFIHFHDGVTVIALHRRNGDVVPCFIDTEDYGLVKGLKWFADIGKWTTYAVANLPRRNGTQPRVRMHCLLINATHVDHRDRCGINNRRDNIRPSTSAQNVANACKRYDAQTSRYKGVHRAAAEKKWVAQVQAAGKRKHLGYFVVEEDAARAYDNAARKLWGEFARCNFALERNPQ